VYPEVIRRGQSAQLHCNYEVFDIPLYSVKWYRGIFEFYRYTPFEHPPGKTFFFNTGIKVDVSVISSLTPCDGGGGGVRENLQCKTDCHSVQTQKFQFIFHMRGVKICK
jgi:hypothetical protein